VAAQSTGSADDERLIVCAQIPSVARLLSGHMLRQIFLGGIVSLGNIGIHAVVMTMVVDVAGFVADRDARHPRLWLTAIMVATVGVLLVAHVAEVITWSLAYWILGAAHPGTDLLDFAFVNYTTLGYGDVVPVERWRLLGPITAMNGILLFGWSTAVMFEVLRRALHIRNRPDKL
jgi:Ion channel